MTSYFRFDEEFQELDNEYHILPYVLFRAIYYNLEYSWMKVCIKII